MIEKRRYEREEVDPIELLIEEIESNGSIYNDVIITVLEVSHMGMRLVAVEPQFVVGEHITLNLPSFNIRSLINLRVVWRKALDDGSYQYGLEVLQSDVMK